MLTTKRIVALEGDLVTPLPPSGPTPVRIPPGHCWVEGDSRFNTRDSNTYGPVCPIHPAHERCCIWLTPADPARPDQCQGLARPLAEESDGQSGKQPGQSTRPSQAIRGIAHSARAMSLLRWGRRANGSARESPPFTVVSTKRSGWPVMPRPSRSAQSGSWTRVTASVGHITEDKPSSMVSLQEITEFAVSDKTRPRVVHSRRPSTP